jgi:pimeloyl-ACP methyl ester carboxylesterase
MNQNPTIHFISGLGADYLAFSYLKLTSNLDKNFAEWIEPEQNEHYSSYISRMINIYKIKEGDIIIGLSFGGMVAVEINKLVRLKQLILLSSTATTNGLMPIIRFVGKLGLNKLFPKKQLNKPNPGMYFMFGAKTNDEKEKLNLFIARGNVDLNYWSINQLVNWKNHTKPDNAIIINGDDDKIFLVNKVKPDYVIKGGTHLMVYNKADEISDIINKIL